MAPVWMYGCEYQILSEEGFLINFEVSSHEVTQKTCFIFFLSFMFMYKILAFYDEFAS